MNKVNYLLSILSSQNQQIIFPNCKSKNYNQIDKKRFGITKLVESKVCILSCRDFNHI